MKERLTIIEASQLYGGTGDTPPTTPMPNDSTQTPSVPRTTPKHTISAGVKVEPNNSKTVNGSYMITTNGSWTYKVTGSYNTQTGGSGDVTVSYTFGGKKK